MKYLLVACMALALSACGGNGSVLGGYIVDIENPQAKAGFNETTLIWKKIDLADGGEEYQLQYLNLLNGQESGELSLELALSDGTIYKFSGGDIKAFGAFETRAQVEQAIAEKLGDLATPELIGSIANLFGTGASP